MDLNFNFLHFIVGGFAVIGIHRIWHWEAIFRPWRAWIERRAPLPPLICPACSPVWIGALIVMLFHVAPLWVFFPFAWYPFVRFAMGLYTWYRAAYDTTQQSRIEDALRRLLAAPQPPCQHCSSSPNEIKTVSGVL